MKKIAYLRNLLGFAYKNNPLLATYPVIVTFSIFTELLAMMTLIPLSLMATGGSVSTKDPITQLLILFGAQPTPKILIITFCFLFVVRIATNVLAQNISLCYGKRVLAQLASSAFSKIVTNCPLGEIEQKSIGHFISLAGDESFRSSTLIIDAHQLVSINVMVTLYFGIIFWYSPLTAMCVLMFLGCSFLLMSAAFRKIYHLGETQIQQSKSASSIFLDSLNGLRTVRSFFAEGFVVDSYRRGMQLYTKTLYKIDIINILVKFIPVCLMFFALGAFMMSGLFDKHSASGVNFAYLITMILFLMRLFPLVGQGLNIFIRFMADAKSGRDVTEMIHYENDQVQGEQIIHEPVKTYAIRDLTYGFGNAPPLFDKLNFRFEAGKSYALIGPSGVGKSTFFNVLSLLNEFSQGELLINGTTHREFERNSLRKKIILVEQESIIFNDSIFNNIALGGSYDLDSIRAACRIACIDDYFQSLPGKYDYVLNYQGLNLSGGQRQRLGIARAVLRNPDILLLDEITSALDTATKHQVIENIVESYREKILIFITHDSIVGEFVDMTLTLSQNGLHEVQCLYTEALA